MDRKNDRVLLLSHKLNVSGASVHMLNLSKGLQHQGWDVAVVAREVAPGTPLGKERFEEEGIDVREVPLPNFGVASDALGSIFDNKGKGFLKLNKVVKEIRPSLFHIHSATLVLFSRIVGMWHRIPTVTTLNFGRIKRENQQVIQWASCLSGNVLGHEVIAISSKMEDRLVDGMGLPAKRVHLIPYAPDSDRFRVPSEDEKQSARKEFGIDPGKKVVSLIGLLERRKGHDVLIRALSRLQEEGIDVTVLCAGSGTEDNRNRIERLAKEYKVADHIRILGRQDARQVMWASDVTVLPSTEGGDSFGLVVVESMLCGVPVVRTPAGGASDQIEDGKSGFIIPFGDDEALADRLERLLVSPSLRNEMGERAEERARRLFSKERMAEETIEVYERAQRRF